MAGLVKRSLDNPEEVRPFKDGMGQLELVNLAQGGVGRATFQPGHDAWVVANASCVVVDWQGFADSRPSAGTLDAVERGAEAGVRATAPHEPDRGAA